MNKRKTALEIIHIEYARYGSSTIQSARAYVENRISMKAYKEAVDAGMKTYNATIKARRVKREQRVEAWKE